MSRKKASFIVANGGLGNQLFQIFACLSADECDEVIVFRNWGNARLDSAGNLESERIKFGNREVLYSNLNIPVLLKRILNYLLRQGARKQGKFLIEIVTRFLNLYFSMLLRSSVKTYVGWGLGYSEKIYSGSILLLGYFQSFVYSNKSALGFKEVDISLNDNAKLLLEKVQAERPVIIHIRRGDYLSENFGILKSEYYQKALKKLEIDSSMRIWVFSDEPEEAKKYELFREFKNVYFVNDLELESREILEIMRYGSAYVIANSSFSWWAATLRYSREAGVIAPKPWFQGQNSPNQILPPEWETIDCES